MKITKKELILKVPSGARLPSVQDEIRENLLRIGVNGLSIDMRYDPRANVALVRFSFEGKAYQIKVDNQKDVISNMYAISKRVEYKARMHLLGIEPFAISAHHYIMLENQSSYQEPMDMPTASAKAYATLGIPQYSSNSEIEKTYKHLCKTFHPDMALNNEAKQEFERRMAEINGAMTEIKKERGI